MRSNRLRYIAYRHRGNGPGAQPCRRVLFALLSVCERRRSCHCRDGRTTFVDSVLTKPPLTSWLFLSRWCDPLNNHIMCDYDGGDVSLATQRID